VQKTGVKVYKVRETGQIEFVNEFFGRLEIECSACVTLDMGDEMSDALAPPLDSVRTQLEAAESRARRIVESLSPGLLGRRPSEDAWSVAECIAHLSLTTDAYVPAIRQALEEGRRRQLLQSRTRFRMGISARLLAWWLEPPYRMKSRTPAPFVPEVKTTEEALPEFLRGQQQLLTLLREANGLALDELEIVSPFAKQLRYNVYAAFRLIAVHQRRHLWQAEQTARKLGAARA
jgi:hypothetical protein